MSDRDEIWHKYPAICHYTKYECVEKIIESKTLWARHFRHLDDEREIIHAKDMLIDYHTKIDKRLPIRAVEDTYNRYLTDVYVTSFTMPDIKIGLKENDGILGMWRFYGTNKGGFEGGCCIEFKTKSIFDAYHAHIKSILPGDCALILDKVLYDGINRCKGTIECKLRSYWRHLKNLIHKLKKGEPHDDAQTKYVEEFISCISLFKHQAFFEEREIRSVVFTNPRKGILNDDEPLPESVSAFDRLEIPFNLNDITKIIVGPQRDQKIKENNIKTVLNRYKLTIPVISSSIPLSRVKKE